MGVLVAVTTASANSVNLNDIGTDADTDGFVDGILPLSTLQASKGFSPARRSRCLVAQPLRLQKQQTK